MKEAEIIARQALAKKYTTELERRLKTVALSIDRQDFAAINDKSYSYMSEILNTNNEEAQKPFRVSFIASLAMMNPEGFKSEVLDFLCHLAGYKSPEKKRDLTPEEENAILWRRIRECRLAPLFEDIKGREGSTLSARVASEELEAFGVLSGAGGRECTS